MTHVFTWAGRTFAHGLTIESSLSPPTLGSKSLRGAPERNIISHSRSDACSEIAHPKSPSFHCHTQGPQTHGPGIHCELPTVKPAHTHSFIPAALTNQLSAVFKYFLGESERRCHRNDPPTPSVRFSWCTLTCSLPLTGPEPITEPSW